MAVSPPPPAERRRGGGVIERPAVRLVLFLALLLLSCAVGFGIGRETGLTEWLAGGGHGHGMGAS